MARYTMEIRELISTFGEDEVESWFKDYNLEDYLTPDEIAIINERGVWSKDQLAKRIIGHFYLREIGSDSVGRFKWFAKDKMAEVMETYAPLIYSASIKYDPLVNVDYTESFDRSSINRSTSNSEISGSSNTNLTSNSNTESSTTGSAQKTGSVVSGVDTTNTTTGSSLKINSDTPQGQVTKANILAGNYASSTEANESTTTDTGRSVTNTNTSETSSDSTTNSGSGNEQSNSFSSNSSRDNTSTNDNGTENYTKRVKGNSGVSATAQKMILQYRENIRALNTEIVYQLESLFMGIY